MVQIKKDKVIFTRDLWEELKRNSIYSELIEDIEDRMELEEAIKEQKKTGNKFANFDNYDKIRMSKLNSSKKVKADVV
ncbi:MAG: hypothetical protein M3R36_13675 [Bacteroidota bacterium]|nr:hypothetical protein [Bacteroidota bacterium]